MSDLEAFSEHTEAERESYWCSHRATAAKVLARTFNYPQYTHNCSSAAANRSRAVREREATAWLDGLRGIAALQVMIFHYADLWLVVDVIYGSGQPGSDSILRLPFIRSFYASGRSMVCAFFVISGYVLTQRTLADLRQGRITQAATRLSSAMFRRSMRLFAPAMVIAVLGFFLVRLGFRCHLDDTICPYFPSFREQLVDWWRASVSYLSPFEYRNFGGSLAHKYENIIWTLPMEMFGSLWCYGVLLATLRMQPRVRNCIVFAIGLYSVANTAWSVFCFMAGMLIADWQLVQEKRAADATDLLMDAEEVVYPRLRYVGQKIFWSVVLVLGITFAGAPMRGGLDEKTIAFGFNTWWRLAPESWTRSDCNYWGFAWSGIFLIASISQLGYAKRLCESTFAQYLGKVSFSVYLLHIAVRDVLGAWLQRMLLEMVVTPVITPNLDGSMPSPLSTYDLYQQASTGATCFASTLWFIIMTVVVFALSGQFEKHVDAPIVRMTRTIEEWAVSIDSQEEEFHEKA